MRKILLDEYVRDSQIEVEYIPSKEGLTGNFKIRIQMDGESYNLSSKAEFSKDGKFKNTIDPLSVASVINGDFHTLENLNKICSSSALPIGRLHAKIRSQIKKVANENELNRFKTPNLGKQEMSWVIQKLIVEHGFSKEEMDEIFRKACLKSVHES